MIKSFEDGVLVEFNGLNVMLVVILVVSPRVSHMFLMIFNISMYSALNMMVGSGLLDFSVRIVRLMAVHILMLVGKRMRFNMMFRVEIEGVVVF